MIKLGNAPLNVQTLTVAGSTQATATLIPVKLSPGAVGVAGNQVGGLRLPPAAEGKLYFVKNTDTGALNTVNIYPATGDAINALATNAALVIPAGASAIFVAYSSTQWYTFPLLPS